MQNTGKNSIFKLVATHIVKSWRCCWMFVMLFLCFEVSSGSGILFLAAPLLWDLQFWIVVGPSWISLQWRGWMIWSRHHRLVFKSSHLCCSSYLMLSFTWCHCLWCSESSVNHAYPCRCHILLTQYALQLSLDSPSTTKPQTCNSLTSNILSMVLINRLVWYIS